MRLSNKTYDILKFIALLIVPICAFVTSIANIFGFNGEVIVGVITAFGSLLGAVLKISTDMYNKERKND